MYSIRAEHGRVKYGVYDFIFDNDKEFSTFKLRPNTKIAPGTTAFIVDTSVKYMLNNSYEWVKISGCPAGGGSGSQGGSGDTDDIENIYDGGDLDNTVKDEADEDYEVIYDGGDQDAKGG